MAHFLILIRQLKIAYEMPVGFAFTFFFSLGISIPQPCRYYLGFITYCTYIRVLKKNLIKSADYKACNVN